MPRKYNVSTDELTGKEIIWYEENGVRVSFVADPANSDYQAYLNPEAALSTPMVAEK